MAFACIFCSEQPFVHWLLRLMRLLNPVVIDEFEAQNEACYAVGLKINPWDYFVSTCARAPTCRSIQSMTS